jgi:hypothetical protein
VVITLNLSFDGKWDSQEVTANPGLSGKFDAGFRQDFLV